MNPSFLANLRGPRAGRTRSRGFTLVELLTVIAIISLLISILVPSVSKARDSAKNAKTRAIMKNIGDGLELFVGENSTELRGQNYPSSKAGDDPTETGINNEQGSEDMCGAQWAVRYLMGKKLDGYVPRRLVPPDLISTTPGEEQLAWYDDPNSGGGGAPRSGLYLDPSAVKLKAPKSLAGGPGGALIDPTDVSPRYNNPVIVDSFEMPILYYAANSLQAAQANANITAYQPDTTVPPDPKKLGIYMFSDNALFTGLCNDSSCIIPRWDFGGGNHKLNYGPDTWTTDGSTIRTEIKDHPSSFAYYILNKDAWESSSPDPAKRSVVPNRRDSYILISPGKDGLFGTGDDVTNF